jgi:hypothetical protein
MTAPAMPAAIKNRLKRMPSFGGKSAHRKFEKSRSDGLQPLPIALSLSEDNMAN